MTAPNIRVVLPGANTNTTTPQFTLPATINAGELILLVGLSDNTAVFTPPAELTPLLNDQISAEFRTWVCGAIAAGTEGGSVLNGALAASESTTQFVLIVEGWYGSLADGIALSAGASGSSVNPDPDSISIPWPDPTDTRVVAFCGSDYADHTATAYPTGYTDNQTTYPHPDGGGGRQAISLASKVISATPEDAAAFTTGGTASSLSWMAGLIAIRPATAGGSTLSATFTATAPSASLGSSGAVAMTIGGSLALTCQVATFSGAASVLSKQVITQQLRDAEGATLTLSGIEWYWYDSTDPDFTTDTPTDSGTVDCTGGALDTIEIPNSTLSDGQSGVLLLVHASSPGDPGHPITRRLLAQTTMSLT